MKLRGFVCRPEFRTLDECAASFIGIAEKQKDKILAEHLHAMKDDIRCRRLGGCNIYFVDSAKLVSPPDNSLATRLAYAYGDNFVFLGKVVILPETDMMAGVEVVPRMNPDIFNWLDQKLQQVDTAAFEAWYRQHQARHWLLQFSAFLLSEGPQSVFAIDRIPS